MTSQVYKTSNYEIFHSWNDLQAGDIVTFVSDDVGINHPVEVSYERIDTDGWTKMIGTVVSDPDNVYGVNTQWNPEIYTGGTYSMGWTLVRREFVYDPAQAGDTEEDI